MINTVYISSHLKNDKNKQGNFGLGVYNTFHAIEDIEIVEIENNKNNSWCRDYMPVKRADGKLVQFKYAPGYMASDIWQKHLPDAKTIEKELRENGVEQEIIQSNIILDGGAIEVLDDQAILSDRVFRDNTDKKPEEILNEIKIKLKLKKLIFIPQDPYDDYGHVDGLARFIDDKRVLINDLSGLLEEIGFEKQKTKSKNRYLIKLLEQWYYSFLMAFENAGLKTETLPCTAYGVDDKKNKSGLYINFLKLDNLIIMPSFGQEEDKEAARTLQNFYFRKVIPVNATKLAPEGGLINCVTWSH